MEGPTRQKKRTRQHVQHSFNTKICHLIRERAFRPRKNEAGSGKHPTESEGNVTSFGKHTRPRMSTHAHARVSSCRSELRTPTFDDTTSDSLKIARLWNMQERHEHETVCM